VKIRQDVLPTLGLSVSEAAKRPGISRQQLHRILTCTHPITTEMALRVHEKINLQFWELRRPAGKARKLKEYQAYFEFS